MTVLRTTLVTLLALATLASAAVAQMESLAPIRASERAEVTRIVGAPETRPRYDLTLDVADDLSSFTLDETITVTNRDGRPWSDVVLRVFVNAVVPAGEAPLVTLTSGECLDGVTCAVRAASPDAIVAHPSQPIADGARVRIRLRLTGTMRPLDPSRTTMMAQGLESLGALSGGHGGGDYGLLSVSDGVASMASFVPVLARRRAGRWEQSDSSTLGDLGTDELFDVHCTVRHAAGVRVFATGLEGAPQRRGARAETEVTAALVRDFALSLSRRFQSHERDVGGVRVRSAFIGDPDGSGATTPDARARSASARTVLDAAAGSLALFERRFGAYPFTELDVVEAPLVGGAGGVEFTGMVTVATMFYRPMDASGGGLMAALGGGGVDLEARRGAMLEFVTAHEVAHQWWHGVVGSDSRRHPFVDEALAQYSAMLYFEDAHGAERARAEAEQQVAGGYHMMRLMGHADGAADRPVSAFAEPVVYAGLVYGKAPYVYRALRQELGDARFFRQLRAHAIAYRFREAPPRALFDRMARGRHRVAVRRIERRWLEEAHGDDDLGQPDLGRMMGGASGADDPAMRELMRMLGRGGGGQGGGGVEELLRSLGGGGGGDSSEALRALMRMLQDGADP